MVQNILNVDCGDRSIDLINGIMVEKLLNLFNQNHFSIKVDQCTDSQFVFNYARLKSIIENMSSFDSNLQVITPLKIVEGKDENELNKFVYNIIMLRQSMIGIKLKKHLPIQGMIRYNMSLISSAKKISIINNNNCISNQLSMGQLIINKKTKSNHLNIQFHFLEANITNYKIQQKSLNEENNSLKEQIEQFKMNEFGLNCNLTINYLKQECLNLQMNITNLEKRNELQQQQIEIFIQYEQKSKDLEQESQNQSNKKILIDELQEKNQILKEQVKGYGQYSKMQKENINLSNYNTQCEQEIARLEDTITQLEQQIKNQFQLKIYTQETPKIPKPKVNCLSEQKQKKQCSSDDKLQRQNDMLRQIISKFVIQQQSTQFLINKCQRGKSLNS
ncbi:unnamed protein product [Paramecium sonneborni]|uniref:Uncharacterized protein n=1 Tax=Paramecium sonneborni TaxID=65129 RepID=A0A8S1LRE3_9CILI|nr:unnamed protein product [Paramecium sonneborni]